MKLRIPSLPTRNLECFWKNIDLITYFRFFPSILSHACHENQPETNFCGEGHVLHFIKYLSSLHRCSIHDQWWVYVFQNTHLRYAHWKVMSQFSESRTMFFCVRKNETCNQKATEVCEFRTKISAFIGACSLQRPRFASCFADIQRIKTSSSFCFWKWKTSRKLELDCMEYFFRLYYRWRKLKRAGKTVAEEEKQNKTY